MIDFEVPPIAGDEFAIVVIGGPSQGESVMVHYGDGNWIIVDSCTYGGINVPHEFMVKAEINPLQVKHIICSHWHDDHVSGMSDLLEECSNAYFRVPLITNAQVLPQYFVYKSQKPIKDDEKEAWKMFQACLDVLGKRKIGKEEDPALKKPQFVKVESSIVDVDTHNSHVSIKALSPSNGMCELFGQMLANGDAENCEFDDSGIDTNMCSVALGISFGNNKHVFLGSDLECNRDKRAACESCVGECAERHGIGMCDLKLNPHFEALHNISYTKINHHSSQNGYCCEYWDNYVTDDCIGVSTAFTSKGLPKKEMAYRYLKNNAEYYLTSYCPLKKLNKEEIKKVLGDNKYITSMNQINTTPGIVVTRYDLETGNYKGTEYYLNAFKVGRKDLKFF